MAQPKIAGEGIGLWSTWWPERLASLLAMLGIFLSLLPGFSLRSHDGPASDMKTLYASAWCWARDIDAYSMTNIAHVFAVNHVVTPPRWFAHSPVYPPLTLAVIAPLTLVSMVNAISVWITLSIVATALALASLAQIAGESFSLPRRWRLVLIGAAAASPLISFALQVTNVSLLTFALCAFAVLGREARSGWLRAAALALAFVLKPHLAAWVMLGLLLTPGQAGRRVAWRSIGMCMGAGVLLLFWTAVHPAAAAQLTSYRNIVHAELASGSMSLASRIALEPASQITSFASLLGYHPIPGVSAQLISDLVLLPVAALLAWATLRSRPEVPETLLLTVSAWCAFGMIATYHRSHDSMVLLLLLPWIAARLHSSFRDRLAWSAVFLLVGMSVGLPYKVMLWCWDTRGLSRITNVLAFRQAAIAATLLTGLLVFEVVQRVRTSEPETAEPLPGEASELLLSRGR